MSDILFPQTPEALGQILAETTTGLRIQGGGTKSHIGCPKAEASRVLSTAALRDVTYFEPKEFVLGAQAGARIRDLTDMLDAEGLSLPFSPVLDGEGSTLGGVVATNLGGAERLDIGAPRDNVLGVQYVNGLGQVLQAGGRVMKNVTGLDMGRALSGSWGRLAVLSEITIKVVPKSSMPKRQFDPATLTGANVWRLSVPAANSDPVVEALGGTVAHRDWNGGLIWFETDEHGMDVHAIVARFGGHALRVRGKGRAFQPRTNGVKLLEDKVKRALDPKGVFDSLYDDDGDDDDNSNNHALHQGMARTQGRG